MVYRRVLAAFGAAVVLAATLTVGGATQPAAAAPQGVFNPEYLISDAAFYDSGSMSESAIQSFLASTACIPRDGVPCLANYTQNTQSRAAAGASQCGAYAGANNESAARIIAKVSAACGISPKVFIVLLQKEQSLITNPSARGYQYATGANCPDTPQGCDPAYSGFFIQVYSAGWQFRQYAKYASSWRYKIGPSYVQYNPNAACGGTTLNIRNQATANLYIYTPYQPNAAALANLYGSGDSCSAFGNRNFWRMYYDWFGSPTDASPIGSVDSVSAAPSGVQVAGWALDFDTTSSLMVHVYVDGVFASGFGANKSRPDVNARYNVGSNYGFNETVPTSPGNHRVCVYAINVGSGNNTELSCRTARAGGGDPIGNLDAVTSQPGGLRVDGWAIDPDTSAMVIVHVYVDGTFAGGFGANTDRYDVAAVYQGYGSAHGYTGTVSASVGSHRVCAYALNIGSGSTNTQLGCVTASVGGNPIGTVSAMTAGYKKVTVSGWAVDPDITGPIWMHVYVDGAFATAVYANGTRNDLGVYQPFGAAHGYQVTAPVDNGTHRVCVYALNTGTGNANTELSCQNVQVGGNPVGKIENGQPGFGSISAWGWAYDLDTADPIIVHFYVDGVFAGGGGAGVARPDVTAIPDDYGDNHGFGINFHASPGTHQVCGYAINVGQGNTNTQLGCFSTTVSGDPVGTVENIQTVGAGFGVWGYAIDPDTASPISVHVYVDGVFASGGTADQPRSDIAASYPFYGANHAYGVQVPASAGSHQVCVYAINTPAGTNPLLGCRTVVR